VTTPQQEGQPPNRKQANCHSHPNTTSAKPVLVGQTPIDPHTTLTHLWRVWPTGLFKARSGPHCYCSSITSHESNRHWERVLAYLSQGGVTPIDSIVTAATALVNPYNKEGVESLCILPYTSVNVRVVDGQRLKFNAVNGQSPKIRVKTPKRAGQSFDLAVAAVTVESMGVTPPCVW